MCQDRLAVALIQLFFAFKVASISEETAVMHGDVDMLLPYAKSPQSEREKYGLYLKKKNKIKTSQSKRRSLELATNSW